MAITWRSAAAFDARDESFHPGSHATNAGIFQLSPNSDSGFTGAFLFEGQPATLHARPGIRNAFDGLWTHESQSVRCTQPREGTYYWGRAKIVFVDGRFFALVNYCDTPYTDDSTWKWDGQLQPKRE